FHLIAWGQNSAIALLCFTVGYLALLGQSKWVAGLALGMLAFKPQLALGLVLVFLLSREWKILFGAVISALVELSVGWMYYGTEVMRQYARTLLRVGSMIPLLEPRPYQMHSLRAFWTLLVPWAQLSSVLYGISMFVTVVLTAWLWRRGVRMEVRYSAVVLASVLVAPHLTVYDLTVLAPALLLLGNWAVENWDRRVVRWLGTLLYLAYVLPLAGRLAAWTH